MVGPSPSVQNEPIRVIYGLETTAVDPEDPEVQEMLNTIWRASKVEDVSGMRRSKVDPLMSPQLNEHPKVSPGDGGTMVEAWPWQ